MLFSTFYPFKNAMLLLIIDSTKKKEVCVMDMTIGKRIASLRKENGLKQDDLAEMLNVSAQAVSKWENDQTCPDISLLPQLAKILGITVDELLSGKKESQAAVILVEEEKRKDVKDMVLRIVVDSSAGDKVRVNLPMSLLQIALDTEMDLPQISSNGAMKNIDWKQILELVRHGAMGNLVEVESSEGDMVRIFVE